MGLEGVIKRNARQTAVYWGNPVNDGEGGFTFASPIEIKCRWEEMMQIVMDSKGSQHSSRAVIYPLIDLDENGMLSLGELVDFTQAQIDDPGSFQNIYLIKRFEKESVLNNPTQFLRKAYLTPSLSFGGF